MNFIAFRHIYWVSANKLAFSKGARLLHAPQSIISHIYIADCRRTHDGTAFGAPFSPKIRKTHSAIDISNLEASRRLCREGYTDEHTCKHEHHISPPYHICITHVIHIFTSRTVLVLFSYTVYRWSGVVRSNNYQQYRNHKRGVGGGVWWLM